MEPYSNKTVIIRREFVPGTIVRVTASIEHDGSEQFRVLFVIDCFWTRTMRSVEDTREVYDNGARYDEAEATKIAEAGFDHAMQHAVQHKTGIVYAAWMKIRTDPNIGFPPR